MTPARPRLPFSTPPWLTPDRIALASAATFATAWALPSIAWMPDARRELRGGWPVIAVVTASTVLLTLLLVRRALRAASPRSAAAWCAFGGIAAGTLNVGLCLGGVDLVRSGDLGNFFGRLLLGCLFGGIFGGPLGLAYGAAYALLVWSAVRARLDPSHDAPDRVLRVAGLWLAAAGAPLAAPAPAGPLVLPPAALVAAGLALAGAGAARGWLRAAWLARVAAGHDPRFRAEPRRGGDDEAGLLPVIRARAPSDHVLLRRAPAGDPYRGASGWVPAALTAAPAAAPTPEGTPGPTRARRSEGRTLAAGAAILAKAIVVLLVVAFCAVVAGVSFLGCIGALGPIANLQ